MFFPIVENSCLRFLSKWKPKLYTQFNGLTSINNSQLIALNKISCKNYSSKEIDDPLYPYKRAMNILKSDMKELVNRLDGLPSDRNPELELPDECDILIIGGGVIGSSIAYWLKQRALSGLNVVVLEKDSSVIYSRPNNNNYYEYCSASTTLSAGGVRQQFSLPENIKMSLFSAEFLRNIEQHLGIDGHDPPDIQFTPQGYLFLATQKSAHQLKENSELQKSLGARNELLHPYQIKERWPWINVDNIELGCHGLENEGWIDPWSLLMAFKKKAQFLGAKYISGELESFNFKQQTEIVMQSVPEGEYEGIREANVLLKNGERKTIQFSQLIIAAGANSGAVGQLCRMGNGKGFLQFPIPVEPRKRFVYCFHCPEGPGLAAPFVIDPSGVYFRREGYGSNYIAGMSPESKDEPPCDCLDVDYSFFDEKIWPLLAHRVPAFESLKVKSAWAGYYDYNVFDENAFIGPHPGYYNVLLATGFSGHGLQQAPAVGRAMMELIIDGRYTTIDLTRMQFERVAYEEYLLESNII